MILKDIEKKQKKKEEDIHSMTVQHHGMKFLNGVCFLAISQEDPEEIADMIRKQSKEYHDNNPFYEFHLLDEKWMQITYYGHGEKREISLKSEIDLQMAHALRTLTEESNNNMIWFIRYPYDYAWIKKAIDCGIAIGLSKIKFDTTQSFFSYIGQDLGIVNIEITYKPTFNKYYKEVTNKTFPFVYKHYETRVEIDTTETNRRNAIVSKFLELMI